MNIKLIYKIKEFYISISVSMCEYYLCVWIHTKLNKLILCSCILFLFKTGLYDIRFEGWICISTHYLQTIKNILFTLLIFIYNLSKYAKVNKFSILILDYVWAIEIQW